jgi:NarL family two-component system response regulator LiaR
MGPVKLFLVDDQVLMRQAIARALSITDKYEVVGHAANASDLIANAGQMNADVIILDMMMSRTSCLEAVQQLLKQGVTVPILVLSGDESHFNVKAALNAGARGFVPKRSDLSEMEFAIDAVAKGGTYVSPSVAEGSANNQANAHISSEALSPREHEIFLLLAQGRKNRDIGAQLSISTRTVDTHRSNILKKLNLHSNAELVRLAISEGLVNI